MLANDHGTDGFKLNVPDEIEWTDGPLSLPKGAQIAVLEGDPTKEGPFVFRVKAPDGYRIPVHTHPKTERVTVISGTFHIGMGDTFDKDAAKPMKAGTYGYWESGMRHFVWIEGETIVQFHGEGPWKIEYVNPADDPRNKKEQLTPKSAWRRGQRTISSYLTPMNPNKALWEKGDFTRIAESMRESGEALVQRIGITNGLKVLDLGCGDGTTAIPAAKLGADVLGVDIARNLVEAGNSRAEQHARGLEPLTFGSVGGRPVFVTALRGW